MLNITNAFSDKQIKTLENIGIVLDDKHDYDDNDLLAIHDKITSYYTSYGFNEKGEPNEKALDCESLIDFFYDEFNI